MRPAPNRLQLHQDSHYQKWDWRLQRVGWGIWAAVLVAAVLGAFGTSDHRSLRTSPDQSLNIHYDRLVHLNQPLELNIKVRARASTNREFKLHVSQPFLKDIALDRIQPEPLRSDVGREGITWYFHLQPGEDEGEILIHYEYESWGSKQIRVERDGEVTVELSQFVYP